MNNKFKLVIIIGSEISHFKINASYRRLFAFQKGFESNGYNYIFASLEKKDKITFSRRLSIFNSNNIFNRIITFSIFLIKIKKRFPESILLVSNLHNRYSIVFYFFSFLFKNKLVDITEEPYAQFLDLKKHPNFKWYRPGHIYHRIRLKFKYLFLNNLYWKHFNIRLVITDKLKEYVLNKTSKKTIVVPVLFCEDYFKNSKETMNLDVMKLSNNKNYFAHISTNSLTKDGLIFLIKTFNEYFNCNPNSFLVLIGKFNEYTMHSIKREMSNINNFIFTGFINDTELNLILNNAKATIIAKPSNLLNTYNFPTRIIDYLYANKPVILPYTEPYLSYFTNEVNSFMYVSESRESLLSLLLNLDSKKTDELTEIGKKANTLLLNKFNSSYHVSQILSALK